MRSQNALAFIIPYLNWKKSLNKFDRVDGYIYKCPRPKARLLGSDLYNIDVYKDIMDGGIRFPIYPFFVSIFNNFHLTLSLINPNAWRKALYFLYICLNKKIPLSIQLFRCIFKMHELAQYDIFVFFPTRVPLSIVLNLGIPKVSENVNSSLFDFWRVNSFQY